MLKAILAFILIFAAAAAIIGGFLRYQKRAERLKAYEEAKTVKREEITVRIPEGWPLAKVAESFEAQKLAYRADFIKSAENYAAESFRSKFGIPKSASLEGFLFPDTYRIYKPAFDFAPKTPEEIIGKALKTFEEKFTAEMFRLAEGRKLTPFQAVTLASIVENETGRNALSPEQRAALVRERKIVAGIFLNRLKIGMPLQSDATINYISGKNDPAPLLEDLKIPSPYNTYLNPGLPPGPISNPSLSSITAVLSPEENRYLYFLHKQPSGEPVYSETYEEHIKNKDLYLK